MIKAIIEEAFGLLPEKMRSDEAELMMRAIQKQEDPEMLRYQRIKRTASTAQENVVDGKWAKGAARGIFQFEKGGGVTGVLTHPATWQLAKGVCEARNVLFAAGACWRALEHDDVFAAAFARLLLWSDPKPLPEIGDEVDALGLYLRVWRPGAYTNGTEGQKSHLRYKWATNYASAMKEMTK